MGYSMHAMFAPPSPRTGKKGHEKTSLKFKIEYFFLKLKYLVKIRKASEIDQLIAQELWNQTAPYQGYFRTPLDKNELVAYQKAMRESEFAVNKYLRDLYLNEYK
jgi:hypothetical protein